MKQSIRLLPTAAGLLHIDDHVLFSQGVMALLQDIPTLHWLGQATTLAEGVARCRQYQPDIVLLDYFLPDGHGLDAARQLLAMDPALRIVFLTMEHSRPIMEQCNALGVHGYLQKTIGRQELLEALETVRQGRQYYMWRQQDDHLQAPANRISLLSKREKQIALLVCAGLTSAEIAERLSLSLLTVSTHRKNLLRKLDIKNAAQLAALANQLGTDVPNL